MKFFSLTDSNKFTQLLVAGMLYILFSMVQLLKLLNAVTPFIYLPDIADPHGFEQLFLNPNTWPSDSKFLRLSLLLLTQTFFFDTFLFLLRKQ